MTGKDKEQWMQNNWQWLAAGAVLLFLVYYLAQHNVLELPGKTIMALGFENDDLNTSVLDSPFFQNLREWGDSTPANQGYVNLALIVSALLVLAVLMFRSEKYGKKTKKRKA